MFCSIQLNTPSHARTVKRAQTHEESGLTVQWAWGTQDSTAHKHCQTISPRLLSENRARANGIDNPKCTNSNFYTYENARFGFYGYENPIEHLSSALQAIFNFHALSHWRVRVSYLREKNLVRVLSRNEKKFFQNHTIAQNRCQIRILRVRKPTRTAFQRPTSNPTMIFFNFSNFHIPVIEDQNLPLFEIEKKGTKVIHST